MLEGITWQQYFTVTGLVATAYYSVTVYRLYGKEILSRLQGTSTSGSMEVQDNLIYTETKEEEPDNALLELEQLVNLIRADIFEQAGKPADKSQLLTAIKAATADFSGLHKPAYRSALNNFIIRFGGELCGADFSEEELEAAWRGPQS